MSVGLDHVRYHLHHIFPVRHVTNQAHRDYEIELPIGKIQLLGIPLDERHPFKESGFPAIFLRRLQHVIADVEGVYPELPAKELNRHQPGAAA